MANISTGHAETARKLRSLYLNWCSLLTDLPIAQRYLTTIGDFDLQSVIISLVRVSSRPTGNTTAVSTTIPSPEKTNK